MPADYSPHTTTTRAWAEAKDAASSTSRFDKASEGAQPRDSLLRTVSKRVVFPFVALGLSTPVVSHAICYVGSRILKHKIEQGIRQMVNSAGDHSYSSTISVSSGGSSSGSGNRSSSNSDGKCQGGRPSRSSKRKKQRRRAAARKQRKRDARMETARLNRERRMMDQYRRSNRNTVDENPASVEGNGTVEGEMDGGSRRPGGAVRRWLRRKKAKFNMAIRDLRRGRSRRTLETPPSEE
ncbi:hypothetical protein TWF696_005852 [Orbilia brochopaga]|uniref:Uncharacterized protein n=1 Tax=Orbilia brochopaga TaxID=3140254 RepID=A0AAV9UYF4_9PEZI